jgi:hypothetical protein
VKYQIKVLRKLKISLDYQNRLVVLSWQLGNPNTTSCCGGGEKPMEKIKFNYSKLRGRITEKCGTQQAFAKLLGIAECTLTSKLNGYTYFTQEEIYRIMEILDINPEEVSLYFFAL